jgi:hypothetical protein
MHKNIFMAGWGFKNAFKMTSRGSDSVRSQHSCDQPDNAVVIKPMKKPEDRVDISWTYEVNFIENPNLRCVRLIGCLLGIFMMGALRCVSA